MEVIGHPSVGHSFTNPRLHRYPSNQSEAGETVCPDGQVAERLKAMRNEEACYRAMVPFMSREELAASL